MAQIHPPTFQLSLRLRHGITAAGPEITTKPRGHLRTKMSSSLVRVKRSRSARMMGRSACAIVDW